MSTRQDSLDLPTDPDRVFYEIGVMLNKDDFDAEQTYHRGRLARSLAFLHGSGTAAGLKVSVPPPEGGGPTTTDSVAAEEVHVDPGIAVDGVGRLIEVPTARCVRLKNWLDGLAAGGLPGASQDAVDAFNGLRKAFHASTPGGSTGNIIVDVMLRFAACDRGKTPAFSTGPFDALDAVQPSRIRDAFELQLLPREEDPAPLPVSPWPDLSGVALGARAAQLHSAIFGAWAAAQAGMPPADPMVPRDFDKTGTKHWIFLARLAVPATAPTTTTDIPARINNQPVAVDNDSRAFVYTAVALARAGLL